MLYPAGANLRRAIHTVGAVKFGATTKLADGVLTVSAAEAEALVASVAPALAEVRVAWASPGQSVRIVKVLDAVEPRTMGPGGGGIFPGFVGPVHDDPLQTLVGGTIHVVRGVAVVGAGFLPRAQEAVVDMSGPAAALSPLGSTHNLVVEFTPAPGAAWEEVDSGLRAGLLALAVHLADSCLDAAPDLVEEIADVPEESDLPRVGVVTNLQTQGAFKDVFVYGRSFAGCAPMLLAPGALDLGAVISGQYGHPALKNPTYLHQNHPVAAALAARHGRDLNFAGVVIAPEPVEASAKEAVSAQAAQVCAAAGFDAVVVTKEGGGNADADMALKMDALEDLGITAVGLFAEMAGPDGTGPSIVVAPERATAMVSTGNYDTRLVLPAVGRALGGEELALLRVPSTAEMELPAAVIYCALSPLGWGRFTCAPEAGAAGRVAEAAS